MVVLVREIICFEFKKLLLFVCEIVMSFVMTIVIICVKFYCCKFLVFRVMYIKYGTMIFILNALTARSVQIA